MMEYLQELFSFVPQCCDAEDYLDLGRICAEIGKCYDPLRPMGAVLWFSLPYRLGVDPALFFISARICFVALSIILATCAMKKIIHPYVANQDKQIILWVALFAVSVSAHFIFFQPTLRTALSGNMANLLVLIAIWLLLLIPPASPKRFLWFLLIGCCLGLATWIRVFFLYPVLFLLVTWLLIWGLQKKRLLMELGILVALIPMLIQVYATWKHTSHFSYLHPGVKKSLLKEHLNNNLVGYDTVLYGEDSGMAWNWKSKCGEVSTMMEAIKERDIGSLYCIFSGRLRFYFGSYSSVTYVDLIGEDIYESENLLEKYHKNTGEESWHLTNMIKESSLLEIKGKKQFASAYHKLDKSKLGEIYRVVHLEKNKNPYVLSYIPWINELQEQKDSLPALKIIILDHETKEIIVSQQVVLSNEVSIKEFYVPINRTGEYDIFFQLTSSEADVYVYEEFNLRMMEPKIEGAGNSKIRKWSAALFITHGAMMAGIILMLYNMRRDITRPQWFAILFPGLVLIQAFISLPEQRFAITPMVFLWVVGYAAFFWILANIGGAIGKCWGRQGDANWKTG